MGKKKLCLPMTPYTMVKTFIVKIIGKGTNVRHKLVFQSHLFCSCGMVPCMKIV